MCWKLAFAGDLLAVGASAAVLYSLLFVGGRRLRFALRVKS